MDANMKPVDANEPTQEIDAMIAALGDWRGATIAHLRKVILSADPEITETVKWRKPTNPSGVPVWERSGIICTGEVYPRYVKLTFMNGATLPDPSALFNTSLEGATRRAIDIREGQTVDEAALTTLIRAAATANLLKIGAGRSAKR